MSTWVVPPVAGLCEPAVAPEFYIDGVGAIERVGSNVRLYCYARQASLDMSGEEFKPVVLKIMRPAETIGSALARMFKIMGIPDDGETLAPPARGSKPELVR